MRDRLAIDFGTSNTAVAVLEATGPRRLALEGAADVLPTAVFLPEERGPMLIGAAAATALAEGEEGRYMRALKSVLGTPLLHEKRLIAGKRRSLAEVITAFLAEIRARAEAQEGRGFARVLSGRPVHFHGAAARDAQALADLQACYHAAGFAEVAFLPEPEAAARAVDAGAVDSGAGLGLVVDIGGGTSDFTLYQQGPAGLEILASHGIRLGGTDFDRALSLSHVMGLLGQGGQLRRDFGTGLLPMPRDIFNDLATWQKIPFLYTRDTERLVEDLLRHAVEPKPLQRLQKVIADELGHALAFAVERGKIECNAGRPGAMFRMGMVERGLYAEITAASMEAALQPARESLGAAMQACFAKAGLAPAGLGHAVLVGGSSLLGLVRAEITALAPQAEIRSGAAFTAVVDGLALASGEA